MKYKKTLKLPMLLLVPDSRENSSKSINYQAIEQIAIRQNNVDLMDLRDFFVPMFSVDYEETSGVPVSIERINEKLSQYDGLILAMPEYNGSITSFFKNIFDWCSRDDEDFLMEKQIILFTVTPGTRGGEMVRSIMKESLPHFGAKLIYNGGVSNYEATLNEDGKIEHHTIEQIVSLLQSYQTK